MRAVIILLIQGRRGGGGSPAPALEKAGYDVTTAETMRQAVALLASLRPDVVVYDAVSLRSDGAYSCRRLRRRLPGVPVIYCASAEQTSPPPQEADVVLHHPFTPRKLLNRIRSVLPAEDDDDQILRVGDLTLYRGKRSVEIEGRGDIALTPKLVDLLTEFLSAPGEVLSRGVLMQRVWKTDYLGDTRTLDVHVRWIRRLIEENPAAPRRLVTVRGQGYRFVPHHSADDEPGV